MKKPQKHGSNIIPNNLKIENIKDIDTLKQAFKNITEKIIIKNELGYNNERSKYINELINVLNKFGAKCSIKHLKDDEIMKTYTKQTGTGINVYYIDQNQMMH